MSTKLNVAMAPKDSTFQVRINSEIKKTVEEMYAKTGMTLTDAFNTFIEQSLNVEGLPFIVTKNSKEALKEQSIAMLMLDLKRAEERAEKEGWIDADVLEGEDKMIDYTAYIAEVNETNPFLRHNHMQAISVSEDHAVVQAQMTPELRNSMGGVHAGLMFSMAEIAAGLLVRSNGSKQVTLDTTFRYLRNSTTDGTVEAEAVYIKKGRTITMCRAYVREQGSDKNLAEGEFSFYCIDGN